MPNRVIKDSIWKSKKLARCSMSAQLHYPRLYLLIDDYGCFEVDSDVIKGLVYPKMNVSCRHIEGLLNEYEDNGLLFVWKENGTKFGYFTGIEEGRLPPPTRRHSRHTPEPPEKKLGDYLSKFNNLEQLATITFKKGSKQVQDGFPNPNPNPNLNPNPNPNKYDQAELDLLFEKWWKRYPIKDDKGKAKSKWLTLVMNEGIDPQELEDALTGYINSLHAKGVKDTAYIKHGKTFLYNGDKKKKIDPTWKPFVKYADPKYKQRPEL